MTTPPQRHSITDIGNVARTWGQQAVQQVAAGALRINHCILATKVLAVALTDRGYTVTPTPTHALVTNPAARDLINKRIPFTDWPDHAYSVGTHPNSPTTTDYPGHLVLTVTLDDDTTLLVDGSTAQFNRPGLLTTPPVTITRITTWPVTATGPDGTQIRWTPAPELGNIHRNAPDWRTNWRNQLDTLYRTIHQLDTDPTT